MSAISLLVASGNAIASSLHSDVLARLHPLHGAWNCRSYWLDARSDIVAPSIDSFEFSGGAMTLASVASKGAKSDKLVMRSRDSDDVTIYSARSNETSPLGVKLLGSRTIQWVSPQRTSDGSRTWIDRCTR